jgi:hypothetical protein
MCYRLHSDFKQAVLIIRTGFIFSSLLFLRKL